MLPFTRIPFIGRPSGIVAGSASYTSPGTYYFTVPQFHTLTADVRGGGGGAGGMGRVPGDGPTNGATGGTSYINGRAGVSYGYGGDGGGLAYTNVSYSPQYGATGASGTGAGSGTAYTGGGAAGGTYCYWNYSGTIRYSGYGGPGGRIIRTFSREELYAGDTLTIVVGAGGAKGVVNLPAGTSAYVTVNPTDGSNGAVYLSWS